jgi:hypothetical protein
MKKLMILMAVVCLVFASCGTGKQKATEPVVEEKCCATLTAEQEEMFANWENWAELEEEAQIALVADMKAYMDECKAKCEAKCAEKEATEEPEEMCPVKKAEIEEFIAKWEAFETLTLEEQKCLIDQVLECKAKCCKEKEEGCKKEHEGCPKHKEECAHE